MTVGGSGEGADLGAAAAGRRSRAEEAPRKVLRALRAQSAPIAAGASSRAALLPALLAARPAARLWGRAAAGPLRPKLQSARPCERQRGASARAQLTSQRQQRAAAAPKRARAAS